MEKARTSNDINGSANHHHLTTELSKHSVLMGRGSGPNEHYGNRYFRMIVAERQIRYHSVDTSPSEKTSIISSIINDVHNLGGLFLKKLTKSEVRQLPKNLAGMQIRSAIQNKNSKGSGGGSGRASIISKAVYSEVDDVTVVEKIKQALRYAQGVKESPADANGSDEGGLHHVISNGNIDGIASRGRQEQPDHQESAPPRKKFRLASESSTNGGASNALAPQQLEGRAPTSTAGPLGYVDRNGGTAGGGKQEREHQGLQQQRDWMNQHHHIPPAPPPALTHSIVILGAGAAAAAATPAALAIQPTIMPTFPFPLQVAAVPPPAAATNALLGLASLQGYPRALNNTIVVDPVLSVLQSLCSSSTPPGTSLTELMMALANCQQNGGGAAAVPAPVPTIATTSAAAEDATQRLLALLQAPTAVVGNQDDSRRVRDDINDSI